jgi:hypothetical protein
MRQLDRNALLRWEALKENMRRATTIDLNESPADKKRRIRDLESDHEAWFKYYFPDYYSAPAAAFQKTATKRFFEHDRWYEVRAWSRELAKSTRAMFETLKLTLTGKARNILLISWSNDNAINLLEPYMLNLEANQRIINDYGAQEKPGKWETGKFKTLKGVSFRAIGAGESPRGTRNEFARPDVILIDDIDTDKTVRNPEQVKKTWDWIERALIPTVSISGNWRILFCGNIIAKDCCITRAIEKADHTDIINIRDKFGKSSWPEKNSEEDIDRLLSKLTNRARQGEYYNNPLTEGTVFKEIYYKAMQPLDHYKFLLAYGDPSFKGSRHNDFKALSLIGPWHQEWHILKCFVDQTGLAQMAEWYKTIFDFVGKATPLYMFMEANATQDLILAQVNGYIFQNNYGFIVTGDFRAKGDKFSRIESLLEPLNSAQRLWFNAREKDNPHMIRMQDQFLALEPALSFYDDGPDSVHGGISLAQEKVQLMAPPVFGQKHRNIKRY